MQNSKHTPSTIKERIGFHQYWKLLHTTVTIKGIKMAVTHWETIFVNHISRKGVLSCLHKEHSKFNSKKTSDSVKKWTKDLNRFVTEEGRQICI